MSDLSLYLEPTIRLRVAKAIVDVREIVGVQKRTIDNMFLKKCT